MIWKDIKGYEGLYQVSSTGLVRSLDRIVTKGNNNGTFAEVFVRGQLMTSRPVQGYLAVNLRKESTRKTLKIHRLVALHFVDGWFEGAVVNHKDGNKQNNLPLNLEWTTVAGNTQHAVDNNLLKKRKGLQGRSSKWVVTTYKDSQVIGETCGVEAFNTQYKELGLNYDTMLNYFNGRMKQYKGYTFTRRLK